jgi:hypothetical protein
MANGVPCEQCGWTQTAHDFPKMYPQCDHEYVPQCGLKLAPACQDIPSETPDKEEV